MRLIPDWIFTTVALLFFGSLLLAISLVPIMAIGFALKSVFLRDDTTRDS